MAACSQSYTFCSESVAICSNILVPWVDHNAVAFESNVCIGLAVILAWLKRLSLICTEHDKFQDTTDPLPLQSRYGAYLRPSYTDEYLSSVLEPVNPS